MMKFNIGDKVKVVGGRSIYLDKVGIYFSKNIAYDGGADMSVAFEGGGTYTYTKKFLEVVEVATYVPVPKFKIGDIVLMDFG